jgi:hypothetical protein
MKENRFKEGDRVFDIRYGWGHVAEAHINFQIKVYFDTEKNAFWFDEVSSRILSFTEYALDGYTAFRPEELPNKGDIVWVRDDVDEGWRVSHFFGKKGNFYVASVYYLDPSPPTWKEISTKNPYENEQ